MALPASASGTDAAPPRCLLCLRGAVGVPHSQETATRHLVRACVSGALGPGLRVVHRDAEEIRFRAATVGARLLGPARATLTVTRAGAQTVVAYSAAVWGVVLLGGLLGVAAGIGAGWGLGGVPRSGDTALVVGAGLVAGLVVAGGFAGAVTHHIRVRFQTLLHNLRYLS